MTDQQLIEAVLKSCGWKYSKGWHWHRPLPNGWLEKFDVLYLFEPEYILTSLDACHEVLPMKDEDFREQVWFKVAHMDYTKLLDMTARDWCEAWLKLKGVEA